ncbi:hypothetical protein [uncultured Sphingomonas sp.]|uniref:hypothetical protein n=1 Tax=uncultured Sphingomonas sp. TaxID=158754 RepID=UPI00374A5F99
MLTNARVVALLDGGGAVIEQADVEYREGRMATVGGYDAATVSLAPVWAFSAVDAPVPDASELNEAQVVIEGDYDGQRIEMRGAGTFGYTNTGHFEGEFHAPPMIILERYPERDEEPGSSEYTTEEWITRMGDIGVMASEQYRRAQRGIALADR